MQYSTGFKEPLEEPGKLTKQKGLYFVLALVLYFNVKDFGIDFMASNGHKWKLSSFGIGAIYIKMRYLRDVEKFKLHIFWQLIHPPGLL